jgi:transposase
VRKKKPNTIPKPETVARAFAQQGYQIETIANHYDLKVSTIEAMIAGYICRIKKWNTK